MSNIKSIYITNLIIFIIIVIIISVTIYLSYNIYKYNKKSEDIINKKKKEELDKETKKKNENFIVKENFYNRPKKEKHVTFNDNINSGLPIPQLNNSKPNIIPVDNTSEDYIKKLVEENSMGLQNLIKKEPNLLNPKQEKIYKEVILNKINNIAALQDGLDMQFTKPYTEEDLRKFNVSANYTYPKDTSSDLPLDLYTTQSALQRIANGGVAISNQPTLFESNMQNMPYSTYNANNKSTNEKNLELNALGEIANIASAPIIPRFTERSI